MEQKAMLALDMGASNGRVVWGAWQDDHLEMREIHRFENVPTTCDGLMRWDMDLLLGEIRTGMRKCVQEGLRFQSVGLCSWGNTVGVLDSSGRLAFAPVHYREQATDAALEGLYAIMDRRALFERTLFVPMSIQPAVVLRYLQGRYPETMRAAKTVLMISDLINYLLCGRACSEQTMAATSGMVDMRTGDWDRGLMRHIGLDPTWFPDIIQSGTVLGVLKPGFLPDISPESSPKVIAVSGHDTASAAGVLPMENLEESLYLSCGTWSCMGCRVDAPVTGKDIFVSGATNDLGTSGERHLRFNHTGLWILQECRRWWNERGGHLSHADIVAQAEASEAFIACVDTEDKRFFARGDMPQKVQAYCRETAQKVPQTPGEIARVVLESLALRYRYSADVLSKLSGTRFHCLHMLSGGSKNRALCQMAANALGVTLFAGPTEASTIGNFIQQGLSTGEIERPSSAYEMLRQQGEIATYSPQDLAAWNAQYEKALRVCVWNIKR